MRRKEESIIGKVRDFFRSLNSKGRQKVLVACSGGPDSVALLCIMNELRDEIGFDIFVGHVDHKLRRESSLDAVFVKNLAERIGADFQFSKST